ncbi:MAG: hypothetical protein ACJARD_001321 [Alphaproteobacteria bacterium]|jgi:uncharacterized protein (TIRG00374 family)
MVISKRQIKLLIASVIIAILVYGGITLWVGFDVIIRTFKIIGIWGAVIVLLLSGANYGLRFSRWHFYIHQTHPHKIGLMRHFIIYLSGFALTTTPAKAGEVIRGIFLKKYQIPFKTTLACFLSERISDLIAVLILCLIGYGYNTSYFYIMVIGCIMVLACVATIQSPHYLIVLRDRFSPTFMMHKALDYIHSILLETKIYHAPKIFIHSLILSIISWYAEAYGLYYVLMLLGHDISHFQAIFIYGISMLIGAISFVPAGIGSSEAVMIALLVSIGVPIAIATAITLFVRMATLWFAVVIGLICLGVQVRFNGKHH